MMLMVKVLKVMAAEGNQWKAAMVNHSDGQHGHLMLRGSFVNCDKARLTALQYLQ